PPTGGGPPRGAPAPRRGRPPTARRGSRPPPTPPPPRPPPWERRPCRATWRPRRRPTAPSPDYSNPSGQGCRPRVSSPFVTERRLGSASGTHHPLTPTW